jgi:adenosylcobinamide-GDP ribazoletransferase
MISSVISTIRTLTIIPVPGKDTKDFGSTLPCFPLIGALLALLIYLISLLLGFLSTQTLLIAIVLVLSGTVLTGALHLDGLADVFDGFGGGKSKDKILEIFKDSRLGTFGVVAIVFDILLKTILYNQILVDQQFAIITLSLVFSRLMQSVMLAFSIPATPGKGITSAFIGKSYRMHVVVSATTSIVVCCIFYNPMALCIMLFLQIMLFMTFSAYCRKKIDGITGDCVGALNELSECLLLVTGVFLLNFKFT